MDVVTMHLSKDVARAKLKAVRRSLHDRADERYRDLESVYEAIGANLPILDLPKTFLAVEEFEEEKRGLPRLAIARADRKRVACDRWRMQYVFDSRANASTWSGAPDPRGELVLRVPARDRNGLPCGDGETVVPGIPPDVRARMKGKVRDHFILWEVEEWEPVPDRDPILLKPLDSVHRYFAVVGHGARGDPATALTIFKLGP